MVNCPLLFDLPELGDGEPGMLLGNGLVRDDAIREGLALSLLLPLRSAVQGGHIDAAQLLGEVVLVLLGPVEVLGDGVDEVLRLGRLQLAALLGECSLLHGGERSRE